jgi:ABC-2 type transport system permease protein
VRAATAQLRAELTVFLREPSDLFFSAALPLLFLVLFTSIFGNEPVEGEPGVRAAQYMVPGFICFALITSGFTALVINLVSKRERGMLKRARATPCPPWVLFFALAGKATLVGAVVTVVLMVVGRLGYDVALPLAHVPAPVVTVLVGAAVVSCLGVAVTVLIGTEDGAPAPSPTPSRSRCSSSPACSCRPRRSPTRC